MGVWEGGSGGRGTICPVIRSPRDLRLALLALAVALPPLALGAPSPEPVVYHMLASVLAFGVWLACASPQGSAGGADQRPPRGGPGPIAGLALGWLAAGLASAVLGVVQYVWPVIAGAAPLPEFIATPASSGRAVGNLRQPNQLTTLLALALCGLAWWGQSRAWPRAVLLPATALLVLGIVLTGSRMGWLMVGMLALWGAVDRGLRPQVRAMLLATVPLAVLFSIAAWTWGHLGGVTYFAEARMQSRSDISSSRFAIWSNTLALIREYPWTGVGWGNFNFAWTLTPFPDRPVAFFDHTHNLVLQLAVELGIPTTFVLLGGLAWAMWRARDGLRCDEPARALASRVSLAMLALVGLHSMLEYPLWYPYFLLPTLVALGIYLAAGGPSWPRWVFRHSLAVAWGARVAGVVMIVGAVQAAGDYQRVVQIFSPSGAAGQRPLAERIRAGQQGRWFVHHADYAAVTTAARPSEVLASFDRPLHRLIDARLMIAYARALHERGETRRALYVAQRLREFRHPLGEQWFAACDGAPGDALPWHCDTTPVTEYGFEDLEPLRLLQDKHQVNARALGR